MHALRLTFSIFLLCLMAVPALAGETCNGSDKVCVMGQMEGIIANIENKSWRDQSYRELAKSYTYAGMPDKAIPLIDKIESPDTKAMTIRGIGFAAADSKWDKARYDELFKKLAVEAKKITHPPSQGIAWTYIAMAQAFAGDNAGATATARSMENDALRHKAFGESAEIQAERGDFDTAMASIAEIDSLSYRNKAYRTVSKILTEHNLLDEAYQAAMKIEGNPEAQVQSMQVILNHGNPEEDEMRLKE